MHAHIYLSKNIIGGLNIGNFIQIYNHQNLLLANISFYMVFISTIKEIISSLENSLSTIEIYVVIYAYKLYCTIITYVISNSIHVDTCGYK